MARKFTALLLLAASAALLWYVFIYREHAPASAPARESQPYARRDWREGREGALNISLYTFRDRNRNGSYDVGDLPMAAVVVDLLAPDEAEFSTRSNINGYANFKMHYGSDQQPISQAGSAYVFRVITPPGWRVTSGNAEQAITFRHLPGSVSGLVAETPPNWVGLAPELTIGIPSAPASEGIAKGNPVFRVITPRGEQREAVPAGDGQVELAAYPGEWRIRRVAAGGGPGDERVVTVTDAPVDVLFPAPDSGQFAPLPYTVTENFEWLQRSIIDKIPNGHLSLDWDYLLAVDNQQYQGPGYVNGLVSGHVVAYNSSGHPVTISAPKGERFDFVGGYFSVAWPEAEGETLDIAAWREGGQVFRGEIRLSYLGPVWLDADLRRIDRLTLATRHYWQFVADDLVFRLARGEPRDRLDGTAR